MENEEKEAVNRMMIKRIKEWAIRKLGGFTSGDCELLYGPFSRPFNVVQKDIHTEQIYAGLQLTETMMDCLTQKQIERILVNEIAKQIEPFVEFRFNSLEPEQYGAAICRAKMTVLIPGNGGVIQHERT